MFGLPWWAWLLIALPIAVVAVVWFSWKSYRRDVRRGFIQYLQERDPTTEVLIEHEGCVVIKNSSVDEVQFYLRKLYVGIAQLKTDTPEGRREVFAEFYDSLMEHAATANQTLSEEEHGSRIMPRLVRPETLAAMQERAPLPHLDLADLGLAVVYVLDAEKSVMFLTQNHANELGLGLEGLHEKALANLREQFSCAIVQGVLKERTLALCKSADTYDAARLLLVPDCLEEGQELLAHIPDRDTLALISPPENNDWAAAAKLSLPPGGEHRLLDRPIRVSREGFRVL
jgi:uncharacterized protein YtpQ (UPF0354 family)